MNLHTLADTVGSTGMLTWIGNPEQNLSIWAQPFFLPGGSFNFTKSLSLLKCLNWGAMTSRTANSMSTFMGKSSDMATVALNCLLLAFATTFLPNVRGLPGTLDWYSVQVTPEFGGGGRLGLRATWKFSKSRPCLHILQWIWCWTPRCHSPLPALQEKSSQQRQPHPCWSSQWWPGSSAQFRLVVGQRKQFQPEDPPRWDAPCASCSPDSFQAQSKSPP